MTTSCATTTPVPAIPGGMIASILRAMKATLAAGKSAAGTGRCSRYRKSDPDGFAWPEIAVTHIHDDNGVVAFSRGGGEYLIVLNFKGNSWDRYNVGVSGRYRELANTSWPEFNVGG